MHYSAKSWLVEVQVHHITIEFIFPGCRSLKEKRARIRGIRERLGKLASVAIAESNYQDIHDRSEWSIVVLAQNNKLFNQILSGIDDELEHVDGQIVKRQVDHI